MMPRVIARRWDRASRPLAGRSAIEFTNVGPGPIETIDIHSNGKFITEWLE